MLSMDCVEGGCLDLVLSTLSVETFQVRAWRFSKPVLSGERPCAMANQSPLLLVAGDAFAGPRVKDRRSRAGLSQRRS